MKKLINQSSVSCKLNNMQIIKHTALFMIVW